MIVLLFDPVFLVSLLNESYLWILKISSIFDFILILFLKFFLIITNWYRSINSLSLFVKSLYKLLFWNSLNNELNGSEISTEKLLSLKVFCKYSKFIKISL